MTTSNDDFWAPRRCLREPIEEIFMAAQLLDRAADAHLAGAEATADDLIRTADMPQVRAWTESLWGGKAANPDQQNYHRLRHVVPTPLPLAKDQRIRLRMPTQEERRSIIARYGRHCVFCGIPLISERVRKALQQAYPDALPWGRTNDTQHAAFQCMWLQFDHVLPHCFGGGNTPENVVVTCAPCNFGRSERTLEQLGLIDPRTVPIKQNSWDGLERILTHSALR